ncbi:hypothetical protein ACFY2Z_24810 [Streptomyces sp. NPDC001222]|uniref:hypothetical protein n=1 Tax=Streptomyces sp. NPDC001222 TaxID=3364548 RepID=UPI00367A64A8
MIELKVCDQGHVIYHPEALHEEAIRLNSELAFYQQCECGTVYLVVIWAGDRARVMAQGGEELVERLEAQDWPEGVYEDANGTIFFRVVPDFGLIEAGFM